MDYKTYSKLPQNLKEEYDWKFKVRPEIGSSIYLLIITFALFSFFILAMYIGVSEPKLAAWKGSFHSWSNTLYLLLNANMLLFVLQAAFDIMKTLHYTFSYVSFLSRVKKHASN